MQNQRGSAIVIVLLFLGIISLFGVGLMLQSTLDTQFTTTMKGAEATLNLADAGAGTSFRTLPSIIPQRATQDPVVAVPSQNLQLQGVGTYLYRTIYVCPAPSNEVPGFDVGTGGYGSGTFHADYWISEGNGLTVTTNQSESTVQMAVVKVSPN